MNTKEPLWSFAQLPQTLTSHVAPTKHPSGSSTGGSLLTPCSPHRHGSQLSTGILLLPRGPPWHGTHTDLACLPVSCHQERFQSLSLCLSVVTIDFIESPQLESFFPQLH